VRTSNPKEMFIADAILFKEGITKLNVIVEQLRVLVLPFSLFVLVLTLLYRGQ
jgi:hypothetical protein